ncbi:hypothetical protein P153DRAFT_370316 [Dothidotthia symphoricarpi CBS 119687]|uniref:Uncharacterized protein n=1 Tax=Dothidotthia symphoricarpi CBS 119687 TaxID=1392245 RepID=A0A6A5ZZ25_9PLEO|nr:uncharacterized protein P153DRAFT_370316 [Dothidotthia symphoricarpi CBS 119687]KAF2124992.1 hypothetical protein P153DRAFT_370316 [Dothidotthia symphoricarpi CBS 119687]
MADQHQDATMTSMSCPLMSIPLEIRHMIFAHATAQDVKPKKLLRYWFEKKEVQERIAQTAATDPNGSGPCVAQNDDMYDDNDDSDVGEDEDENENDEQNDDDDSGEEDSEHENHNEDEEDEDMDDEAEDDDGGTAPQIGQPLAPAVSQLLHSALVQSQASFHTQIQAPNAAIDGEDGDDDEDEEAEAEAEADYDDEDDDGTMDPEYNEDDPAATATQRPPQAPVIRPHRKWRHIPKFMRITHCPPPVELLLASKQLSIEAKNWYYDVAVLRIEATGSFAHTSFFEEAFSQIVEAAFSPMENIRKVEVTFVWDTTWLRADETGCADAIFPALLRQRANFVFQILSQAPDLKELVIDWHDSAEDTESVSFKLDILEPFFNLPASVDVKEHYIAKDAKPYRRSVAGKRRIEFQNIVDRGLDRLF